MCITVIPLLEIAGVQVATTWRVVSAVVSIALALTILIFGKPGIERVRVDYPVNAQRSWQWVEVPFRGSEKEAADHFRASAVLWRSPLDSGLVRIRPDDCIETVMVNQTTLHIAQDTPGSARCWPNSYVLDLSHELRIGRNVLSLYLNNRGGVYGIDIIPMYSQTSLIAIAVFSWLAVYVGTGAMCAHSHWLRGLCNTSAGRAAIAAFVPSLGPFLMASTILNNWDDFALSDHAAPTLLAAILPAIALLCLFNRLGDRPLAMRPSWPCAALSVGLLAVASTMLAGQWTNATIKGIALSGAFAGFFASVPVRPFLHRARQAPRAVAIAVIATLSPHVYWALNLLLWGQMAEATGAIVRALLWITGLSTTTYKGEKTGDDGVVLDYHVYVASQEFSIQIGAWCSGLEGVSLFVFLLSVFVLFDWSIFSKVKHLWVIYVLTVPFVLAVNAARIAGLFMYAVWNVRKYGHTQAVMATVDAFHSNIGWVVYTLAFAVFLPVVYRWATRSTKAKQR